jgi:hypothetical protein
MLRSLAVSYSFEAGRTFREAQLHDPSAGRLTRDVDVQAPPTHDPI